MESILFKKIKKAAGSTASPQSLCIKYLLAVIITITASQRPSIAQTIDTNASVTPGKVGLNSTGNNQFAAGDLLNKRATFPGGDKAFIMYLMKNVRLPENYTEKIDVTISVEFTIEASGKLKDLVASDGPKDLQKEAMRVIKTSGKWQPAYQGDKPVTSQRT